MNWMELEAVNWMELLVVDRRLLVLPTMSLSDALCLSRLATVEVMNRGKDLEMTLLLDF